ncbi:hypothetical protein BHY_1461 (plasmid) [Borrelia nietonii YOR]|uniref:Uncharacterized protein n=1 Tax=Borrelia nietonii YOR TaxID=1293576 RepID=W5SH48_9SPIR|nr:hypothetical protein BHY_1461 [Borrelia nietonii YOR]
MPSLLLANLAALPSEPLAIACNISAPVIAPTALAASTADFFSLLASYLLS